MTQLQVTGRLEPPELERQGRSIPGDTKPHSTAHSEEKECVPVDTLILDFKLQNCKRIHSWVF